MRTRWWIATASLLAGCQQQGPENGVDTTLPADAATIRGSLSAPSEYLPSDIKVCVEAVSGQVVSCAAKIDASLYSGTYEIQVPPGSYRIYATTSERPGHKAYYVRCNSQPACHTPSVITIAEGSTATGIDPTDWGDPPTTATDLNSASSVGEQPSTELTPTDMNATDMNSELTPEEMNTDADAPSDD